MKAHTPKIKALLAQIESGKIKTDAGKILNFIIKRGTSNAVHMESLLPMFNKTLSARISDLEDLGLIYKSGTFNDGKHSSYSYEPDPEKQQANRLKRHLEKFEIWKARGLKDFAQHLPEDAIEILTPKDY